MLFVVGCMVFDTGVVLFACDVLSVVSHALLFCMLLVMRCAIYVVCWLRVCYLVYVTWCLCLFVS